jgi:hypothetical protein
MKKRREEQRQREHLQSEARIHDQTVKKQKLDELRQKQLEIVAASVAVSRQKTAKQKVSQLVMPNVRNRSLRLTIFLLW